MKAVRKISARLRCRHIEVWENQYSDRDYVVDLTIPEFTCICPKTALPDFALIKVSYKPAKVCLELKSLKLYLVEYRNVGIFHEHLVNKLLDDLVKACHPRWMRVEVIMNPRGGIGTTVTAEYQNVKNKRKINEKTRRTSTQSTS